MTEQKRKWDNRNSVASNTSSELSLKRIKEALSFEDTPTSMENITMEMEGRNSDKMDLNNTGEQVFQVETNTPVETQAKQYENIVDILGKMLDTKLLQQKADIVKEVSHMVNQDIDGLKGQMFELENKNTELSKRIEKMENEREVEKSNIMSAKNKGVENDQYARRSNIIVYGVKEERSENPGAIVSGIVKDYLGIWLRPDAI